MTKSRPSQFGLKPESGEPCTISIVSGHYLPRKEPNLIETPSLFSHYRSRVGITSSIPRASYPCHEVSSLKEVPKPFSQREMSFLSKFLPRLPLFISFRQLFSDFWLKSPLVDIVFFRLSFSGFPSRLHVDIVLFILEHEQNKRSIFQAFPFGLPLNVFFPEQRCYVSYDLFDIGSHIMAERNTQITHRELNNRRQILRAGLSTVSLNS